MEDTCILSDFDGTITEKDGLYGFFENFANEDWQKVEKLWENNKISSKECLKREFECIPNLNKELADNYIKTLKVDKYFKDFFSFVLSNKIDFYIVSDGVDYFINKILKNNGIENIKIISNHFELKNNTFELTFPNSDSNCIKNSGTCKCEIIKQMKKRYNKIIYIGDGTSDYCPANKADLLFAKGKLINYCKKNNIPCIEFKNFNDILKIFEYNAG